MFILAGEASGDRIGAALVRDLKRRADIELTGVGGAALSAEGLKSLFPISDLSVMGFADVLMRLPLLLWRLRQTRRAILRDRPDVVVLIDAQEFSARVAEGIRHRGYQGTALLYVAPTVWAWRPERAAALKGIFDEVLAVLPFEPKVMSDLGGPRTSYVGHPALERTHMRSAEVAKGPVLLLPGSRGGELRRHLPLFRDVVVRLKGHPAVTGFVLPTLDGLADDLRRSVSDWSAPVDIVTGEAGREAACDKALIAIAAAGTVTLELALSGVPMVITYVGDRGQARRFAKLDVKSIGLPNIVLGEEVVPELILSEPDGQPVVAEAIKLINAPERRAAQRAAFARLRATMDRGSDEVRREDPADRVLANLKPE